MNQVLTPQESILVTVKKSVWVEMGLPCRPKKQDNNRPDTSRPAACNWGQMLS